jgi:hypothetical protein
VKSNQFSQVCVLLNVINPVNCGIIVAFPTWACRRSNPRPLIFCLFLCPLVGISHATQDLHTRLCT